MALHFDAPIPKRKFKMTFAWINKNGEFLVVSNSTTHTGRHVCGYFTKDLNACYVSSALPKRFTDGTPVDELVRVPAWAERKVFIGEKPAPAASADSSKKGD